MLVLCNVCQSKVEFEDFRANGGFCPECHVEVELCGDCGRLVKMNSYNEDTGMCLKCVERNSDFCSECGELYLSDFLYEGVCEECYEELQQEKEED